jgi:predicted porin
MKGLIALAVLGAFSGATLAQSNVTLYGIADVNYQRNDPDSGSATNGINGGHQSGNRFGLRGSEALGGGLSAIFALEAGYSIDTGTSGQSSNACGGGTNPAAPCGGSSQSRLFGRQAWVGLESGLGSFVAGRIAPLSSATGSFDLFAQVDPFGGTFGDSGIQNTFSAANSIRVDNSALWRSPVWAGFRLGALYSFNVSGPEPTTNEVTLIGLGGSFAAGPFYAVITYDIYDIPGAPDDQTFLQIGGTWDLKIVKLQAAWASESAQRVFSTTSTTTGADADAWMVGVTVPLFGGSLLASYQDRDGDPVRLSSGVIDERDLSVWAIGYTYPLSRRTNLYVSYSDKDGDKTLNNSTSSDRSQFTVGMRHLF